MQRWRRFLCALMELCVLVLLGGSPKPDADRRFATAVRTGEWLFAIACVAGLFWTLFWTGFPAPPATGAASALQPADFFGPLGPVLTLRDWFALAIIGPLGVLCLLATVAGSVQVLHLLLRGRRTTATVIADARLDQCDHQSNRVCQPAAPYYPYPPSVVYELSVVYDPKFRFTDPSGQTHIVSGALARFCGAYHLGQRVPLIYLPGHPETFMVDRFADKWGAALFFFIVSAVMLVPCLWEVFDLHLFFIGR